MRKEQVKKNPRGASMTTKQDDNTLKSLELSEGQLEIHFRRLNLAHTRRIYKEVADRAEKESWSYRDFLALLLAEEVARRKQTRLQRCTRSAHFPFFKTIDEFLSGQVKTGHTWSLQNRPYGPGLRCCTLPFAFRASLIS